ncbi:hypothetical protein GJU39_07330 [Pedobacter petrophilus]|uniref:PorV/PorQ family protein n=1 Tax=Pedobacter petrophilus TaxID=1908241 RepID=A0A7K0FWG4_9SPHI|nr:hypothetical protein [Pedobacter petrophilus]MRX75898.1 hypothetical protein [Pedobacter petrophilus]
MKILYCLSILLLTSCVYAQNNLGPRLSSMADNGTAVVDIWSLQANPAGIAFLDQPAISLNYIRHLLSEDISSQGIVAVIPFGKNYLGTSFQRYGFSAYDESKVGFAYSKRFGEKFSLALNGNYHELKISSYGSSTGFSIDFGIFYRLSNNFSIGAFTNNPSAQKFNSDLIAAKIPTSFNFGASYLATNQVLIATTVSKVSDQSIDFRLGLEYKLYDLLSLRGGLSTKPFKQHLGFGLNYKKFAMDMATTYDTNLGYAPQIAIGYAF